MNSVAPVVHAPILISLLVNRASFGSMRRFLITFTIENMRLGVALRAGLLRALLSLGPASRTAAHPAHP